MITTAVVCPHPPALLRELGGLEDPVADLREACAHALGTALAEEPDTVVVVGGAAATAGWQPSVPLGVRRFGTTTAHDATYLPQSLGVAHRLLEEAGWDGPLRLHAVAFHAGADEVAAVAGEVLAVPGRTVLVVMADGSARRGEKAPGHLDERAFGYDDEVCRAVEEGDAAALAGLDAPLAADLLVQGRAALAILGTATALSTSPSALSEAPRSPRPPRSSRPPPRSPRHPRSPRPPPPQPRRIADPGPGSCTATTRTASSTPSPPGPSPDRRVGLNARVEGVESARTRAWKGSSRPERAQGRWRGDVRGGGR